MSEYAGKQFVGIDLHRRRSVIVRTTDSGEVLESVRIVNDVESLDRVIARGGEDPEVVLEATYGWYWAVDALQKAGANVHLAHPLGVKAFEYRRVKNDLLTELPGGSCRRCVWGCAVMARFTAR
ncbi:IS110 family transposase, partial [Nocardioides immobilis]|uniref:IS110 family transposase n=1 Tax=Nocardioides immobilis TaxID=2049295 RepID=UPI001C70D9F5